ncbi:MAG: D-alanine--D-alanine ligase A, partial [Chloroflexota bacterium]
MSQKKIRVGIVFGGRSGEHEVSLMSARSVLDAIDRDRYDVVPIGITKTGRWLAPDRAQLLLAGDAAIAAQDAESGAGTALAPTKQSSMVVGSLGGVLREPLDLIFPVLHGPYGEDGTIQGFLDLANIPYVGAGVLGSALGMDKAKQKEVLRYHQLLVVQWVVLRRWQWREDRDGCLTEA